MTETFQIARFDGDGIGPEIMHEAVKVIDAAQSVVGGFRCEFTSLPAGAALYRDKGVVYPDESRKIAEDADAIFLASMGLPEVCKPDGTEVQGDIIVVTRRELDLYQGVRPVRLRPNVPSPLRASGKGIDMVVLREQSEGLFASYQSSHIVHDQVYSDSMIITRRGTERICKAAFELATNRSGAPRDGIRQVTCVDKSNNFKAMAFFNRVFTEIARDYPAINTDHSYIDAIMLHMLQRPDSFDVLVLENMYGDILSDLTAGIAGGMGFAPSGDIGDNHAMFQCAGGSAPDIAGRGIANPAAQILSGALMLDWLGRRHDLPAVSDAASRIDAAIDLVLQAGFLTSDAGGSTSTVEFGDRVVAALGAVRE